MIFEIKISRNHDIIDFCNLFLRGQAKVTIFENFEKHGSICHVNYMAKTSQACRAICHVNYMAELPAFRLFCPVAM